MMTKAPDPAGAARPTARDIYGSWVHFLAFGFGSGLSPRAPGTAGTLVALPIWWLLRGLPLVEYAALLVFLFASGCWICGTSARRLGVHDYGGIVFDEIVGLLVACVPLLPALGRLGAGAERELAWTFAAFVLFRLFDIWKPWPIRVFDRRIGGGFGIMFDDLIAAAYAAALLAAALALC